MRVTRDTLRGAREGAARAARLRSRGDLRTNLGYWLGSVARWDEFEREARKTGTWTLSDMIRHNRARCLAQVAEHVLALEVQIERKHWWRRATR